MADYNDKWKEFFDEAAADQSSDDDFTRIFGTTNEPITAKPKRKPESSRTKREKTSRARKSINEVFNTGGRNTAPDRGGNPVRFRRDRRVGILGGILYFVFVVSVSGLLASLCWFAATDVLALGKTEEAVEITIPENYEVDEVAQILYENGVINYRGLFKFYGGFANIDEKIKAGTYLLYTNYDYRAIVTGLTPAGGTRVSVKVTVPEGYTLKQTFELLEERGVCKADKLWDCAANYEFNYDFLDASTLGNNKRLEGFLFPDTYEFYLGQEPEAVIKKFLSNFNNRFNDDLKERAANMGYTIDEIIIVASLIEEEAAGEADREMIASVIYNRLKSANFPYLQFDSTINYVINETGEKFSTDLDSPYNTYKYQGLPVGPISNPGMAAINAALYPEDTSYYYYALDIYGEHRFFKNYDGFLAFVNSSDFAR